MLLTTQQLLVYRPLSLRMMVDASMREPIDERARVTGPSRRPQRRLDRACVGIGELLRRMQTASAERA